MKIDGYYRQCWAPAGIDPDIFEITLGQWLEAQFPSVLEKLVNTHEVLTEDEATTLILYVELQRFRVPRQAEAGIELMRSAALRSLPDHIVSRITAGEIQIHMKDSARFDFMRFAVGSVHPWLGRMEWEVVIADSTACFLTSDSPVCFYNPMLPPPAEAGIGLAGTKLFFPLSSTHLLLMRHPECRDLHPLTELPLPDWQNSSVRLDRGRIWPHTVVRSTNWKIAALAHDLIVASSARVLQDSGWDLVPEGQ